MVVKPVAMAAVEVSIKDTGVAWLERGEAAMLASALMAMAQHSTFDPLVNMPGGESGDRAKV